MKSFEKFFLSFLSLNVKTSSLEADKLGTISAADASFAHNNHITAGGINDYRIHVFQKEIFQRESMQLPVLRVK